MEDEFDQRKWFFSRSANKTIISKRIEDSLSGKNVRIASHVIDGQSGLRFASVKDEIVLRRTPEGRFAIKATFLEDDRSIRVLTIQKYSSKSGPLKEQYFHLLVLRLTNLSTFLPQ